MRFAIVDNRKVEAKTGSIANCPGCYQPVIAKCGDHRVHHWAHSKNKMCDTWWEPETEWHRNWKGKFPEEWQEDFLIDNKTGEKHIADIRTDKGLVIEFQHSHINPQERLSREAFYKSLTWVVDGSRLKRDYPRFLKGKEFFKIIKPRIFRVDFPEEYFPSAWLDSAVPVLFDFQNITPLSDPENKRHILCCLLPVKIGSSAVIAEITENAFVNSVINGEWAVKTRQFINDITQVAKEHRQQLKRQQTKGEQLNTFLRYSVQRRRRF
jgi:competence protein CoiA